MRDLSNLDRLAKLKEEAISINKKVKTENELLKEERDSLIEKNVESFIDELKVLSKYGSAGGTGIKLDFHHSSYGDYPEIIHEVQNGKFEVQNGKFSLLANPTGYSKRVVLYDCDNGWDWYAEETKKFIAMNKDRILDAIEEKISQRIVAYIEDSSATDKNVSLKKEIEQLKK